MCLCVCIKPHFSLVTRCFCPSKAITEQLASKKDDVAEAIRSTEGFLRSKQASKYVHVIFIIQMSQGSLGINKYGHSCPTCTNLLLSKCRLSPEERAQVEAQLDELKATYTQLCDSSNQQLQQLQQQLAKEEERKVIGFKRGA